MILTETISSRHFAVKNKRSELISIVLCTHNGERYIKEQIESILKQTWENIEVIISDDNSTDSTIELIQQFANDRRIKLFRHNKPLGASKNFEFAMQKSSGAYIACCDQDDIWIPSKIQRLYEHIQHYPLIYSNSQLVDDKGRIIKRKLSDLRNMYTGNNTRGFIFENVVWGHTLLFKKELLKAALPIPDNTAHDIWLAINAVIHGGIKYHDEVLTYYRQHSATLTKTIAVPASRRSLSIRYNDYLNKLQWIEMMKTRVSNHEVPFYESLHRLFLLKNKKPFAWPLFFFLMKHAKEIFRFRKKSYLSNFIEIIKMCRGEKNSTS